MDKNYNRLFTNGFFYCNSHGDCGDSGIFCEADLIAELMDASENDSQRRTIIEGMQDWCHPFKEKIKRSCRTYQIEIPSLAEN